LSASNSTLCKLIRRNTEINVPVDTKSLITKNNKLMLCPCSALNEICRQKKITKSKKNIMSLLRKCQSFHKINEKINEFNVENNLKVSDRKDIASTNKKKQILTRL
jgi:hypothetical protein